MEFAVFSITVVAEVLSVISVAVSILFPCLRIWPPSQERAWTGHVMWCFFLLSAVGTIAVGIVDWGGLGLAPWLRGGVGVPLWLGGCAFAQWAVVVLGLATTFGDRGRLVQRGPYRISRNPQYVGFVVGLIGWALVSSSAMTTVASLVGVISLVLVPFAEEPWLEARYGTEYMDYRRVVPRFVL